MKKWILKKKLTSGILLIAGIMFTIVCCKTPEEEYSTCRILPQDGETNIKVLNSDYLVKFWETKFDSSKTYRVGIGEGKAENIEEITDWLGLPKEISSVSIVFYVNKFPAKDEQLTKENIVGCQYYYVVEGSLMHKFYYSDKGKMVIVKSLTGESNGINYNDRQDIYSLYFFNLFENVLAFEITDNSVRYRQSNHNDVSSAIEDMLAQVSKPQ